MSAERVHHGCVRHDAPLGHSVEQLASGGDVPGLYVLRHHEIVHEGGGRAGSNAVIEDPVAIRGAGECGVASEEVRRNGAVGAEAGAEGVRMQREDERQGGGDRGGRRSVAGCGGGMAAKAEQGGARLGVGLEGLCRGRQRWAIGQAELERLHRKG